MTDHRYAWDGEVITIVNKLKKNVKNNEISLFWQNFPFFLFMDLQIFRYQGLADLNIYTEAFGVQ